MSVILSSALLFADIVLASSAHAYTIRCKNTDQSVELTYQAWKITSLGIDLSTSYANVSIDGKVSQIDDSIEKHRLIEWSPSGRVQTLSLTETDMSNQSSSFVFLNADDLKVEKRETPALFLQHERGSPSSADDQARWKIAKQPTPVTCTRLRDRADEVFGAGP